MFLALWSFDSDPKLSGGQNSTIVKKLQNASNLAMSLEKAASCASLTNSFVFKVRMYQASLFCTFRCKQTFENVTLGLMDT